MTSVDVERLFSECANVLDAKRNRTKPDRVDQQMFLNKNMYLLGLTWFSSFCVLCPLYLLRPDLYVYVKKIIWQYSKMNLRNQIIVKFNYEGGLGR